MPKSKLTKEERERLLIQNRCGRLLVAALITYIAGEDSADGVLKRYVPKYVDPVWSELGQQLANCLQLKIDPRTHFRIVPETPPQRPS